MVASASDRLANQLVGNSIRVQRFGEKLRAQALAVLGELEADLDAQIRRANLDDAKRVSTKLDRARDLQARVRKIIRESYSTQETTLRGELVDLAEVVQEKLQRGFDNVFSANLLSVEINPGTLRRVVDGTMIEGNPTSAWWAKQSSDLQFRFEQQVRLGILQGETSDQIVRRIRGTESGRRVVEVEGKKRVIKTFSGGILGTSTREASALVRTSVQAVSNRAILDGYEQNAGIIRAIQPIVTLDLKTSETCIARSGAVWLLETGEPAPESKVRTRFPGPPPWHFNCRTVLGAITYTWEQLIRKHSPNSRIGRVMETVPDSKRASMDGRIAGDTTYEAWLRGKSPEEQIRVLGKGKRELWLSGDITLPQLIDQTGRSLTLAELRGD